MPCVTMDIDTRKQYEGNEPSLPPHFCPMKRIVVKNADVDSLTACSVLIDLFPLRASILDSSLLSDVFALLVVGAFISGLSALCLERAMIYLANDQRTS